jgi:hypothetical protein
MLSYAPVQKREIELLRVRVGQLEAEQLENAIHRSAAIIDSVGSPPHLTHTSSTGFFSNFPPVEDPRTRTAPASPSPPPSPSISKDKRSRAYTISNFIRATSPPIKIIKQKSPKNTIINGMDQASPPTMRKEPSKIDLDGLAIPSPTSSPKMQRTPSVTSKPAQSPPSSPKISSSPKMNPFMPDHGKPMLFHAEPLRTTPYQINEACNPTPPPPPPPKVLPPLPPPKVLPTPPDSPTVSLRKSDSPKSGPLRLEYPKPPSFRVDPAMLPKSPVVFTPYTLYESKPSRYSQSEAHKAELYHPEPMHLNRLDARRSEPNLHVEIPRTEHSRPESLRIDVNRTSENHFENILRIKPSKPISVELGINELALASALGSAQSPTLAPAPIPMPAPAPAPIPVLPTLPSLSVLPPLSPSLSPEPVRISTVRPVSSDSGTPAELKHLPHKHSASEAQPVRITAGISLSSDHLVRD